MERGSEEWRVEWVRSEGVVCARERSFGLRLPALFVCTRARAAAFAWFVLLNVCVRVRVLCR